MSDQVVCVVCTGISANITKAEVDYTGTIKNMVVTIGYKMAHPGIKDLVFAVRKNSLIRCIKEVEADENERVVRLPFNCVDADVIELEVSNETDTTDVFITHKAISLDV